MYGMKKTVLDVLFSKGETLFSIFVLIFFTGILIPFITQQGAKPGVIDQQDLGVTLIFLIIVLTTLFLLYKQKRKLMQELVKEKSLLILLIPLFLSISWSVAPLISFEKSLGFLGALLFGVYYAFRYTQEEQLTLLSRALGVILVISFLIVAFAPLYGISHEDQGAWIGPFSQKNIAGKIMALALLVFLCTLEKTTPIKRMLLALGIVGALVFTFFSESKTAVMVAVCTVIFLLCLTCYIHASPRLRRVLITGTLAIVILGGFLALSYSTEILFLLNKDTTLTGRTSLWQAASEKIAERPWLGYGYGAFWEGPSQAYAQLKTQRGGSVIHGHNGLIDSLLDLGVLGTLSVLLSLCIMLARSIRHLTAADTYRFWPLAFLSLLLLNNITESTLLRFTRSNFIFIALYAALALTLARKKE